MWVLGTDLPPLGEVQVLLTGESSFQALKSFFKINLKNFLKLIAISDAPHIVT